MPTAYHNILREYLDQYAIPGMLRRGWAIHLAKDPDYEKAQRADYHIEQPLQTHILNGLFALTHTLEYLDRQGYRRFSEAEFKRILVLYTLHDAYKEPSINQTRQGQSDFSVPLATLEEVVADWGLRRYIPDLTAAEVRAASVSSVSDKMGDLSDCPPDTSALLTAVHLADAFASQQTARDYFTSENYLRQMTEDRAAAFAAHQGARLARRTGRPVEEAVVAPALAFYYHELDDYRGLSTLLIHQATAAELAQHGLYPILYFANGTLYLGPAGLEIDATVLRAAIRERLFAQIKEQAKNESISIARAALKYGQGLKFSKYVYLFSQLDHLIGAIQEWRLPKDSRGFVSKVLAKRVAKRKYAAADEFYTHYTIAATADQDSTLAERWQASYNLLMGIENVAGALLGGDTLDWLLTLCATPPEVAAAVRANSKALRDGGVADHCLVLAYHWLQTTRFGPDRRQATQVDTATVQAALTTQAVRSLTPQDQLDRRMAYVDTELGLKSDAADYLQTHLLFSFAPDRSLGESPLKLYTRERSYSHNRFCVICNRPIPRTVKDKNIITDIAEQQALVFSNRLLPSVEVGGQMVWCPMCYLEFMLRKLTGQSLPTGSDSNASRRVNMYVLPDYSFTPALWQYIGASLLGEEFGSTPTVVSKLNLHGKQGVPARWLAGQGLDEDWLDAVRQMFVQQAEYMNTPDKAGRQPRNKPGDHLRVSFRTPNYVLMSYDNAASDQKLAPTRSEIWVKALYAGALIHLLTGARVYLTERPYLSITRPEEMRRVIEMEGLPPLLYGLLPVRTASGLAADGRASESSARLPLAALLVALDLLAAAWEITGALHPRKTTDEPRNLDKQIAEVFTTLNSNPLAGATLYKALTRDKETVQPYPTFTRACAILLPHPQGAGDAARRKLYERGYELMLDREGGEMMNLAERITDVSLQLYLPFAKQKGRAHRYETLFRTGVEALKSNAQLDPQELRDRVAGHVLKRLIRVSGGAKPLRDDDTRMAAARQFAELMVYQLFDDRCGRSVSKLTHEENWMADAIYFLTAQQINDRWAAYKNRDPEAAAAALQAADQADAPDEL